MLWFAWKQRLNLLTITIVVVLISFVLNIRTVNSDVVAAFYSPQTRFWELLVGSILAYLTLHRQRHFSSIKPRLDGWLGPYIVYAHATEANGNTLRNMQSLLGAALIAAGIFYVTKEKAFPGYWAVLPTAGALLIIAAGKQAWLNRTVLSSRVLVWFGLISFPLYLWHWVLLAFTRIVWHWPMMSFAREMGSEAPSISMRMAAVLFAIVLAWLTYRLIEKPIRFGKSGEAITIALLVFMVIIGYVGYNTYKRDGLEFRLPEPVQQLINNRYVPATGWQDHTCFLYRDNKFSDFDSCKTPPEDNLKPILFLWGDSHAASMYPGYKKSFGEKYRIVQRTVSSCAPILMNDHICDEYYSNIFNFIRAIKPNKIVLAANWGNNGWQGIEATVVSLREIGVTNIDLIGPLPQWNETLPKELFLKYKYEHQIPERMTSGINQKVMQLDLPMSELARKLKVNYYSPIKILCNENGCLTKLGETGDTLITYDLVHLTEVGSRFLIAQFPKN